MKLSFLKKTLLSGVLIAGLLAGSLIAALPTSASPIETMLFTPASQTVSNGATNIAVPIVVTTDQATRGWGSDVHFDATKLQETGYSYGSTFFTSSYGTLYNNTPTVDNTNGIIAGLAQGMLGGSGGPTGTATLVTIYFNALPAANNSLTTVTMVNAGLSDLNAHPLNPTTNSGSIVVGQLPDLIVSAISTTPADGSSSTYNLNFTIKDTVVAAAASSASYTVNGGASTTVQVGALLVNGTQNFSIPLTISASGTDSVVVKADSTNMYGESNNTNSISYSILPDLVVSGISTSPASSPSSPSTTPTYTISYTITNNGPAASVASNTAIVINGGTPINIACGALASGASLNFTTGTLTVTGTHDSIVVTADSGHGVQEWNENNNSAIDDYYYTSPNVISGNQDITGTLNTVFSFTAPAAVNQWTYTGNTGSASAAFFPGQNNINAVPNTMVVNSNQSWVVTASGENGGYLSKWNSGYASPIVSLGHQLFVASSSNQDSVAYSLYFNNSAQTLATGNTTGLNGSSGYSRTIPVNYIQNVTYNDAALASPYIYHMTATYTCTTTAY